jgi:ferric-dicitrate binding protein FerR (iron transport regulator)
MSSSRQALEAWKRADADARAAESRLLAAWELFEKRLVAVPGQDLLLQVAQMRGVANEKLSLAMITLAAMPDGSVRDARGDAGSA